VSNQYVTLQASNSMSTHTHTHTHTLLPLKCVLLKSSIKSHYGFYYNKFLNDKTEEEVKV